MVPFSQIPGRSGTAFHQRRTWALPLMKYDAGTHPCAHVTNAVSPLFAPTFVPVSVPSFAAGWGLSLEGIPGRVGCQDGEPAAEQQEPDDPHDPQQRLPREFSELAADPLQQRIQPAPERQPEQHQQ